MDRCDSAIPHIGFTMVLIVPGNEINFTIGIQ